MQDNTPQIGDDTSRPVATSPDLPRHDATADDILTIEEIQAIFRENGRLVGERTLQRYCAKKHFKNAIKRITSEGEVWFAPRISVYERLKELDDFDKLRKKGDAASRGKSRHVADVNTAVLNHDITRQAASDNLSQPVVAAPKEDTTTTDLSRQVASETEVAKAVARLEELQRQMFDMTKERIEELRKDKEILKEQLAIKDQQLTTKDMQIERFFTSERETKTLFGRVTGMLNGIWPNKAPGERFVPASEALDSGLEHIQADKEQ